MNFVYSYLFFILVFSSKLCSAIDRITATQFLRDPETIVSKNSIYKLGFFSPPNSTNRYVGIWYNQPSIKQVVWVANRYNPLTDSTGVLRISVDGNLQVSNAQNHTLWSSNVTHSINTRVIVAQLQDSGNLIVQGLPLNRSRGNETTIWQSFQHPTDSVLPNMRFSFNKNSELRRGLQAWRTPSDPSVGRFSVGINSFGIFQIFIWDGDRPYWRSGPWNGNIFVGTRYHDTGIGNIIVNTGAFAQEEGQDIVSLAFTGANETLLPRYVISYAGTLAETFWDDSKKNWETAWHAPENECDTYGKCGEFGNCNPKNKRICSCLKGFVPKNEEEWKRGNWSSGCKRRKNLQCGVQGGKEDGFMRLKMTKVPDNAEWVVGLNPSQCRINCLNNCSCVAYTHDTGIGCLRWSGSLIDIENLSPGGMELFIRLEQSELGKFSLQVFIFNWSI